MPSYTPEDRTRVFAIYRDVIRPVHAGMMQHYGVPDAPGADAMSIAALYQESKGRTRDQGSDNVLGPAVGFWQFEKNGGVAEILEARQTKDIATALCASVGVTAQRDPVWRLFATAAGDDLAAAFARLLLWKDPRALPPVIPASGPAAYDYYMDNWRPGAKRPQDWPTSWEIAVDLVTEVRNSPTAPRPDVTAPPAPAAPADLAAQVAKLQADVDALKAMFTQYGARR